MTLAFPGMRVAVCLVLATVGLAAAVGGASGAGHLPDQTPQSAQFAIALLDSPSDDARERQVAQISRPVLRDVVISLMAVAERKRLDGDGARALSAGRLGVKLADRIDEPTIRARALNRLGSVHNSRSEYKESLDVLAPSRDLSRGAGDKSLQAETLGLMSVAHFYLGDLGRSLAASEEGLSLYRELNDPVGIATVLAHVGMAERQRGDYDRAVSRYEEAIALAERAGAEAELPLARALNNFAVAERERGNNDRAIVLYQRSFELHNRLGFRAAAANNLSNLGMSYQDKGLNDVALDHFVRGLTLSEAIGDRRNVANALGNLGFLYRSQGNDALAVEYYRRALAEYEAIGSKDGMARITGFMARVHTSHGDYAAAEPLFAQALALRRQLGDRAGLANETIEYGRFYEQQGNLSLAVEHMQEGLKLLEEIRERRSLSFVYLRLAGVQNKRGAYKEALAAANRAAELTASTGQQARYWATQLAVGRAWRGLGDVQRAGEAFDNAIASIERLREQVAGGEEQQQRAFEQQVDPYHEMVALLAAAGDAQRALTYAERAKGRVQVDVLRHGRVNVTRAMSQAEQDEERRLNATIVAAAAAAQREHQRASPDAQRLADLQRRADEARAQADAFRAILYARHPELKARRSESPPVTAEDLAALVPDHKTACIEYVVTRTETLALVVTKGSDVEVSIHKIDVAPRALEQEVSDFRERLGRRDLGFRVPAKTLHARLLEPLRNRLEGRSRLVIVPEGPLWDLPFQALLAADGHFLLERYTLSFAPSLTALREQRRAAAGSAPRPRSVIAFGDPPTAAGPSSSEGLRADDVAPLPATAREVTALKRLYGPKSRVFTGREATEARFKREAGSSSILHVSTHGVLNNGDPMSSHLLLGPSADQGAAEDGRLQAREILSLDLDSDLAVLSGCETARGRVGAGEGVIGLTWAFFVAGVPTTVVSQWKVDSESTARLMVGLHRRLAAGATPAATPAGALRASALALLGTDRYRHPFYWAGFVVVGDGLRSWR